VEFFLGTHNPAWLERTAVPMVVSRRRLEKLDRLPRAKGRWVLDSGGFSELSLHGTWTITVKQSVAEVRRYVECIGNLAWAASMDWMTEENILEKTGKTIEAHQVLTVLNYVELMGAAPDLPWVPVLQGRSIGDYWHHVEMYQRAGVDLKAAPVVGCGSLCRRQLSTAMNAMLATLARVDKLRIHAFGYKLRGLALAHLDLASSDSLAWSYAAAQVSGRKRRPPSTR